MYVSALTDGVYDYDLYDDDDDYDDDDGDFSLYFALSATICVTISSANFNVLAKYLINYLY